MIVSSRIYRLTTGARSEIESLLDSGLCDSEEIGYFCTPHGYVGGENVRIVLYVVGDINCYMWVFPAELLSKKDQKFSMKIYDLQKQGKIENATFTIPDLLVRELSKEELERAIEVKSLEELFFYEPQWRIFFESDME